MPNFKGYGYGYGITQGIIWWSPLLCYNSGSYTITRVTHHSAPLKLGTYTTNSVKLIGSCLLYMVHPDTKCLQEVTFFVASNVGSVLLSCVTTLALGLIQPHTSLNHLPLGASLISSSADQLKEYESVIICSWLPCVYPFNCELHRCMVDHHDGRLMVNRHQNIEQYNSYAWCHIITSPC